MYEAGGFLDKCQPFLSLSLPVVFSHLSQHTSETSERRPFPDPAGLSLHPSRRPPSPRGTLLPQHHPHVLPRVSVDDPVPTRVREAGASPVYLLSIPEISPCFAFPTRFVCHPRAHGPPQLSSESRTGMSCRAPGRLLSWFRFCFPAIVSLVQTNS